MQETPLAQHLAVAAVSNDYLSIAQPLAERLGLALLRAPDLATCVDYEFVLLVDAQGISLQQTGKKAPGPIRADFIGGSVNHRRKFGGGKGQMIAKAIGVKSGVYPAVLDVTAGLGKDAFVLATLGCSLTMVERSPVVHCLLADGLARALDYARLQDSDLLQIVERMQLVHRDSLAFLQAMDTAQRPDVIYVDPMFPERSKAADVKKEMKAFHTIVGRDLDAGQLLELCLTAAKYRVVVKRPRKAPTVNERQPSYQLEGKSSRYDIYTLQKLPDKITA